MRRPARAIAALALAAALVQSAAAVAADPPASLPDVEDEVMCPVCGTSLELANGAQAERERALIRRLIDRGADKDEIKDALVAEYGEEVLAVPDDSGFDLAAWVVPVVGILGGALLIGVIALRRSRRPSDAAPEARMGEADSARLDEDMSRYEL